MHQAKHNSPRVFEKCLSNVLKVMRPYHSAQLENRLNVGKSCTSDSQAYLILGWDIGHKGEHRSQTRAPVVPHKSRMMRQLTNFVFIYQDAHLDYCHITFRVKDVNLSARGFRNEPAQMTRSRPRPTAPFYVRDFCLLIESPTHITLLCLHDLTVRDKRLIVSLFPTLTNVTSKQTARFNTARTSSRC